MRLVDLHKNFIKKSAKSIVENALPIKPVKALDQPLIVLEKWKILDDGFLTKKFFFKNHDEKNRFVISLLNYESEVGHHANLMIEEKSVIVRLMTHDVKKITELDMSYRRYADIIRKDIAYNPDHE